MGELVKSVQSTNTVGPGGSSNDAGHIKNTLKGGIDFQFQDERKRPPVVTRAIIYQAQWHLQWMDPTLGKKGTTPRQIKQEGALEDGVDDDSEHLFSAASRQAGKNLAQAFKW